ncbi:MAG: GreA/GreB family elongation factor [Chitinophagaceae bacterium]|nr:GreA/GreB family elongation factor [Chitinophagaceae bacterium]
MKHINKDMLACRLIILISVLISVVALRNGYIEDTNPQWVMMIIFPLIIVTIIFNSKLNNMQKAKKQLVLLKDDYSLLVSYLNGRFNKTAFDRRNAEDLQQELKKAKLVSKEDFPADVVRLNSVVRIKAEDKDDIMEMELVTPERADIKAKRISIMAPIGTALLGFRKGEKVNWHVPAGKKTFTILEVING